MRHNCPTCSGPCGITHGATAMPQNDVIEDLQLAQERWHKARREGKYFRAEKWAQMRDLLLDHLT